MKKIGYVCVYGRANAGKSSLINRILGFKLLPVSSKPQTTRDNVQAVYNDPDAQIVFVDTPGVFRPHGKLGSILLKDAENAKVGVDLILYVVDASEVPNMELAMKLSKQDIPVILVFNKIDLVRADIAEERLKRYAEVLPVAKTFSVSCKDNFNIDKLVEDIKGRLPVGECPYPEDMVSDHPSQFIIREIIREKCMRLLSAEVPHSIYVDLKNIEEDEKGMEVYADIIVEKESEKGIVIGHNGAMISKISKFSEEGIQGYFGKACSCDLRVKVVADWRNSDKYLRKFGYEE
jgi:GTP-binding protein Era